MLEAISHNTLKHLVEAGSVRAATAIAQGDSWALVVKYGMIEKTVRAKNSGQVRVWRKLDTLAKYIKQLGISKFETDATNYDPTQKTLRRPDAAKTLKRAHAAAEHDKWFRAQVQKGLADTRPSLSHDQFKQEMESWLTKEYGSRPRP